MNEASTYEIHSTSSVITRPVVLSRAQWKTGPGTVEPQAGTWFAFKDHGPNGNGILANVVPMIGCPRCSGLIVLSCDSASSAYLARVMRRAQVPVVHAIDRLGKVTPKVKCMHAGCGFEGSLYLDRWQDAKPLFAIAYTRGSRGRIEIAYSHATNAKEARVHLGPGDFHVIGAGPAIGFFVDEKTGRITAD
jgi:hypothetical protein